MLRQSLLLLILPTLTWAAPMYLFELNHSGVHWEAPPVSGFPFDHVDFAPWTVLLTGDATFFDGTGIDTITSPFLVLGSPYPDAIFHSLGILNSIDFNEKIVIAQFTSPTLVFFRYHALGCCGITAPGQYGFGGDFVLGPTETRYLGSLTITEIPEPRSVFLIVSGLAALIALGIRRAQ